MPGGCLPSRRRILSGRRDDARSERRRAVPRRELLPLWGQRAERSGEAASVGVHHVNAMTNVPSIAVTCGEPAGIGPELLAMLAQRHAEQRSPARLVFVGDRVLLSERAQRIGLAPLYVDYDAASFAPKAAIEVLHRPLTVQP